MEPRVPHSVTAAVLAKAVMLPEYSSTRMDSESELSRGNTELLEEDKPYDEEERAKDLVETNIKSLEHDLKSITDEKTRFIIQNIITCLSRYYSLQEMQTHMTSTIEEYFKSIFADDQVGLEAYLAHSMRLEAIRHDTAEKAIPKNLVEEDPDPHHYGLSAEEQVTQPRQQVEAEDEEAIAKDFVAAKVQSLKDDLESIQEEDQIKLKLCLIASLTNYFTLEEMQAFLTAETVLEAEAVENIFEQLFDENQVARTSYIALSLRMETRRAQAAEGIAKDTVKEAVKSLEVALESSSLTDQNTRGVMQSLITCFSNYYTLDKMKEHMTSATGLTAAQVEKYFNRYIGKDELKRVSYMDYSFRIRTAQQLQDEPFNEVEAIANAAQPQQQPRDEPYDENAMANAFVAAKVESFQDDLKSIENTDHRFLVHNIIACLRNFFTPDEMLSYIPSATILGAEAVKRLVDRIFVGDEMALKAYSAVSIRKESDRRQEAAEKAALKLEGHGCEDGPSTSGS